MPSLCLHQLYRPISQHIWGCGTPPRERPADSVKGTSFYSVKFLRLSSSNWSYPLHLSSCCRPVAFLPQGFDAPATEHLDTYILTLFSTRPHYSLSRHLLHTFLSAPIHSR